MGRKAGWDNLRGLVNELWRGVKRITRRQNAYRAFQALIWKLRTTLNKQVIRFQDRHHLFSYAAWLKDQEKDQARAFAQIDLTTISSPLVTLVSLSAPGSVDEFEATLAALQAQKIPSWEWLIDVSSTDGTEIRTALEHSPAREPRIRVCHFENTARLADRFSAGLAQAAGQWIGLLTCGDRLSPLFVSAVAEFVGRNSNCGAIYFDEDSLAEAGMVERKPFLKPDWSPEMLLSTPYLEHALYQRETILRVLKKAREDASPWVDGDIVLFDWDLSLRCSEDSPAIGHIPAVLYHRRLPQSVSSPAPATSALTRRGLQSVETRKTGTGAFCHTWRANATRVSILIPTRDRVEYLRRCVCSIQSMTVSPEYELLLLDTGSQDPATFAYYRDLEGDARIHIITIPGPFNYSKVNNRGAIEASGELLLFINNDIEVLDADWLDELSRWAMLPGVGVVGGRLLYPDHTIQHAGIVLGLEGHANHVFAGAPENTSGVFGSTEWYRDYLAVTGACLLIRRSLFEQIGGFDEEFSLVFNDVDLCLRAYEAGYRIVYTPFSRLIHYEGASRGFMNPTYDLQRAYHRFKPWVVTGDPYFNPGLSHALRIPTLRRANEEPPVERLENTMLWA